MRINKKDYYINIAKAVSQRSTCTRRQYGAIIVKNDRIISTGYNGSPRGSHNCCDDNKCVRKELNIPHGTQYELCASIHAEQNAMLSANASDMVGATMYLYGHDNDSNADILAVPCVMCSRMIINVGIKEVVNNG